MTKEQKLIEAMAKCLAHVVVDANMALNDEWDRSDDGFIALMDDAQEKLDKVEKYDLELYNRAVKESRQFVADLNSDEEGEDKVERDYI